MTGNFSRKTGQGEREPINIKEVQFILVQGNDNACIASVELLSYIPRSPLSQSNEGALQDEGTFTVRMLVLHVSFPGKGRNVMAQTLFRSAF